VTTPPNRLDYIQFRGWTAAEWAASDPIPGYREPCWSTDTHELRVGDGVTHWSALPVAFAGTYVALTEQALRGQMLTSGEENMPRESIAVSSVALSTTNLILTYFTARKTETCNNIKSVCGGVAAAATPTLCRMGVYSVAANGDLTLVAACASDTAMWATINTIYTRALTSAFSKVAGQRYATGLLVVTAATAPQVFGTSAGFSTISAGAPRISGYVAAQADLPANVAAGSISNTALRPYVEVLP
jgi:hypothetical protein